jgi:citronellyl-CoA dehydrogenase
LSESLLDTVAAQVWHRLGADGRIAALYTGPGGRTVDPAKLRDLLTAVDAEHSVGTTLGICVQAASVLPLLAAGTTPAVAQVREAALRGETVVALAVTDAGPGSDLTALHCTADIGEQGVTVTGHKRWITNATHADHFLVLARHRAGPHFTNFTWVLVPAGAPGVTVEAAGTPLFAGGGVGHVYLDGVALGREHLVGRVGHGMATFARQVAVERLAGALWAVALGRRMLAGTAATLDGRDLRRHDVVRHHLAAAAVRLAALDALCERHAAAITGSADTAAAAVVKVAAADTVDAVLSACARLQGADGFADGGARLLGAEAGVFGVGGGTADLVLGIVADHLDDILQRTGR